jgi:prolyl-tRNA synthetase
MATTTGCAVPPMIAPHQIVIVPMLRDTDEDAAVLDYCEALAKDLAALDVFCEPARVLLDRKPIKASNKRWSWVKKGAPIIVEVGGRDVAGGNVSVLRRDKLYNEAGKTASIVMPRDTFIAEAVGTLRDIQASLYEDAKIRLDDNIRDGAADLAALAKAFDGDKPGWVLVEWAKPSGEPLEKIQQWLKGEKLTLRNAPLNQDAATGNCIFTGEKAVERVLVGRSY